VVVGRTGAPAAVAALLLAMLPPAWAAEPDGAPAAARSAPLADAPPAARSAPPADAPTASHLAAIRELIAVTGTLDRELARVDEVVAAMRTASPDLPEAVWTNYAARLRDREALVAAYAPAYARHLDEADTRAWLAFHDTPLGRRVLAAQEPIREASRVAAQRLATEAFAELVSAPDEPRAPAPTNGTSAQAGSDAAVAPTHAAAIRELIELTGALGSARTTMKKFLDAVRASPFARSTPADFWSRAAEKLTDPEALYALWIPAYAANLSEEDVRALVAFHRTPAGARIAAAQPAIQAEIVDAAQQFGATAARRAVREVLGPLPTWRPPPQPEPAR
jgi:hypothetical protein